MFFDAQGFEASVSYLNNLIGATYIITGTRTGIQTVVKQFNCD